jgi:hypothetical protein
MNENADQPVDDLDDWKDTLQIFHECLAGLSRDQARTEAPLFADRPRVMQSTQTPDPR